MSLYNPRMKRIAVFLMLAAGAVCPAAFAQASAPAAPTCPATPTLDALVSALYAAVSGPANQDRTCFRDVFLADAKLTPIVKKPDGSFGPRNLTVEDWISLVAKHGDVKFYEKGVLTKTEVYGNLAHLWSTYETREDPNGKPTARGINSIQVVFDGTRWKVQAILWQAETPETPLPAKYLP
jgi:hypothetical protein